MAANALEAEILALNEGHILSKKESISNGIYWGGFSNNGSGFGWQFMHIWKTILKRLRIIFQW